MHPNPVPEVQNFEAKLIRKHKKDNAYWHNIGSTHFEHVPRVFSGRNQSFSVQGDMDKSVVGEIFKKALQGKSQQIIEHTEALDLIVSKFIIYGNLLVKL